MRNRLFAIAAAIGMLSFGAVSASTATAQDADDALITSQVKTAFFYEPVLRTAHLNVKTTRGVVQLTGAVEKAPNVQTATEYAASIPGVVAVENELVNVIK